MSYSSYSEMDIALDFTSKCGFTLKDLQIADIETFSSWQVSGNFMEVGAGKTVMSTAVALMRKASFGLVVCPPVLLNPWVHWLKKFSDKVVCYRGTPRDRQLLCVETAEWVVVSTAIFRIDYERLKMTFIGHARPELIVDEAHQLKNIQSVLFKKVKMLSKVGKLQMLTGTPLSKPLDAYSYISLIQPTAYRSYQQFENMHVSSRDFFGKPTAYTELETLAKVFAVKTITRSKLEIHGYKNDPLYPDSSYDLSPEHYKLYKQIVDEQLLQFDDGTKLDMATAQKLYHGLQQVICNFDYFSNDPNARSAALDLVDQTIEETDCLTIGKTKLIIWTVYKRTSARVLKYLLDKAIKAVAAYSETNSSKSFDSFMDDPDTRILVANTQSAGAGLNPQSVCSEALFLEFNTVPLLTRQAIGRLDRVGQKNVPRMKLAVATGTIQEYLLKNLLENDALVGRIEATKASLKSILFGEI